jgi:hypothetical protein
MRRDEPDSPERWYARYRKRGDSTCAGEWTEIARTASSITFERRIPTRGSTASQTSFNRVLYGEDQVFLLTAAIHGDVTPELRAAWLAVLASAKVAP